MPDQGGDGVHGSQGGAVALALVQCSRRGDRVKILAWDHGGFVLYYKRLERGRFRLPALAPGAQEIALDAPTLAMLLSGIDVRRVATPPRWQPSA